MARARRKIIGIYRIVSPSGKFYIGSSVDTHMRKLSHQSQLRTGNHANTKLRRSYAKYGMDAMKFEVIFCMFSSENIYEVEQKFIDEYKPHLNMSMVVNRPLSDPDVAERWKASAKNSKKFKESSMENLKLATARVKKKIIRSDGMIFDSAVDASNYMGYPYTRGKVTNMIAYSVRNKTRCKSGFFWKHLSSGTGFEKYVELENNRNYKKSIGTYSKSVIRLTDGMAFPSAKLAADYCNLKHSNGICQAIKRGGIAAGHRWAYANT